ncbi:hypothetical protein ACFLUJ_09030 [Chloroflexota bacterium]
MQETWKPTVSGILNIVGGALSLLSISGVIVIIATIRSSQFFLDALYEAGLSWEIGFAQTVMIGFVIFLAIVGTLSLVGGLCALQRIRWGWALTGSIASIVGLTPLGVASIILIVIARDEFQ